MRGALSPCPLNDFIAWRLKQDVNFIPVFGNADFLKQIIN
jgi:hypothetical protein